MKMRPVWAEVDLSAIAHNVREIRRIIQPQAKIMAIVKANAYGHGAVEVSETAMKNGADYLGVAVLAEAVQLREAGIKAPILILGYNPPDLVEELIKNDITQTVFHLEVAEALSRAAGRMGKIARIHIKIDTGMSRVGFMPGPETLKIIEKIAKLPHIEIEGIFTHFAVSDIKDKSFTLGQLSQFLEFVRQLEERGIHIPIKHAANSGAIVDLPETHLDMVRPGILIYGLYPSEEVKKERIDLKPAMTLKAKVVQVKTVPPGTSVSYGRIYVTDKDTQIASLPLGYADGFTRLLSNKGEVLIHGKRADIIGRVCMDQCMADVTGIENIVVGDEAVLFGEQKGAKLPVEEVAAKIDTINYEIICMLSERVPRVYLREDN